MVPQPPQIGNVPNDVMAMPSSTALSKSLILQPAAEWTNRSVDLQAPRPHNPATMRVRILVVLAVFVASVAAAQPAPSELTNRYLSLPRCVELALTHNLDVRIARASSEVARFNLSGSYGAYDPVFSFRAGQTYVSQPGDFDPQKLVDFSMLPVDPPTPRSS